MPTNGISVLSKLLPALRFAALNDLGPHYRSALVNNQSQKADESLGHFPDYQELFGELDYKEVDQADSIFSPAAYLVDLLRFVRQYIEPVREESNQPANQRDIGNLDIRRPDLDHILLNRENTFTEIPKLEIVNNVLELHLLVADGASADEISGMVIRKEFKSRLYEVLSAKVFPFSLPFHLPLEEIRLCLAHLNSDLVEIWETFANVYRGEAHFFGSNGITPDSSVNREVLGLSPMLWNLLAKESFLDEQIFRLYSLPRNKALHGYESIGAHQFMIRIGLSPDELNDLLQGNLSDDELADKKQAEFYINDTNERTLRPPIEWSGREIKYLTRNRLHRMLRVIRLSRVLDIPLSDMDWIYRCASQTMRDVGTARGVLAVIAQVVRWRKQFDLSIDELCVFIGPIKDFGGLDKNLWYRTFGFQDADYDWPLVGSTWEFSSENSDPESSRNLELRSRLMAAYRISAKELDALGEIVSRFHPDRVELTVDVLTSIYRICLLSRALKTDVSEILLLGDAFHYFSFESFFEGPGENSITTIANIIELKGWLNSIDMPADELAYALGYNTPSDLNLSADAITNFVTGLSSAIRATLVSSQQFKSAKSLNAETLLKGLTDAGIITTSGVVPAPIGTRAKAVIAAILPKVDTAAVQEEASAGQPTAEAPAADPLAELTGSIVTHLTRAHELQEKTVHEQLATLLDVSVDQIAGILRQADKGDLDHEDGGATTSETSDSAAIAKPGIISKLINAALVSDAKSKIAAVSEKLPLVPEHIAQSTDVITESYIEDMGEILSPLDRLAVVVKRLKLSGSEVRAMSECPQIFPINASLNALELADLRNLAAFKSLVNAFRDTGNNLIKYLRHTDLFSSMIGKIGQLIDEGKKEEAIERVFDAGSFLGYALDDVSRDEVAAAIENGEWKEGLPGPEVNDKTLAEITGWTEAEISGIGRTYDRSVNAYALSRWKERLDLCRKLWLMPQDIKSLAELRHNPPYADYKQARDTLIAGVKAKYGKDDWQTVYKPIHLQLLEKRRDALVPLVMDFFRKRRIHNSTTGKMETTRDLYEYLLIDVDVAGVFTTSVIKEALACIQLFIYRCRAQLEPGLQVTDDGEKYWEWMRNYRVWEANRKTFLYPENYIQPELRKDKTPLFASLEEALQQGPINEETVDKAVSSYLDGLAEIANLETVGAYMANADSPKKMLYLIGRTQSQPNQFYFRSAEMLENAPKQKTNSLAVVWSPWRQVDLVTNATTVSPVFAFGKLFVFWAEIQPDTQSNESKEKPVRKYEAQIQYTFLKYGKTWVAPQKLGSPVPLNDFSPTEITQPSSWKQIKLGFSGLGIHVEFLGQRWIVDRSLREVQVAWDLSNVYPRGKIATSSPIKVGPMSAVVTQTGGYVQSSGAAKSESGVLMTRYFSEKTYPYIEITIGSEMTQSPYLETIRFRHSHNHNYDFCTKPEYYVRLQHSSEDGQWRDLGFSPGIKLNNATSGRLQEIKPWIRLTPGKHRIRWVPSRMQRGATSTNSDYFAIHSVELIFDDSQASRSRLLRYPSWIRKIDDSEFFGTQLFRSGRTSASQVVRLNSDSIYALSAKLFAEGIPGLLSVEAQRTKEGVFPGSKSSSSRLRGPIPLTTIDYNGANAIYFWELFFHTPFLVAKCLTTAQQHEAAQKWYHYIFNPTIREEADGESSAGADRFWRFLGLRPSQNQTVLEELGRSPNEQLDIDLSSMPQLQEYHDDPFNPHTIAQLRPIAYQKTVVMHYIDNLLQWADRLFIQNTRESLVEAELLYVLAYDLLGVRPRKLGRWKRNDDMNVGQVHHAAEDVPEFLVGHEHERDDSKFTADNPNNYIPGAYFGIPENEQFVDYWNRVEGRLYNLRNYLTIDGKPQQLGLFQPPIDPAQLVAAVAAGAGVSKAIAGVQAPIPHYRFTTVLEKAKQVTQTVIQFGSNLLSAIEKSDAEELSALRATHERALLDLNMESRTRQLDAAESSIAALELAKAGAGKRVKHYDQLIKDGLSIGEVLQFELEGMAIALQGVSVGVQTGAIPAYLVPTVFGMSNGKFEPGDAVTRAAGVLDSSARILSQSGGIAATAAQFERRAEEWELQRKVAEQDVQQIEKQIEAARFQRDVAQAEITWLEKNISQADEISSFLEDKFSNQDLYQWMIGRLSGVYFQAYQLAYSLAIAAQRCWQFERADTEQTFVHPGHWFDLNKGLLAGESLLLDLHRMEKAYLDQDERRFEIVKTVSMSTQPADESQSWQSQLNKAFFDLKEKGTCNFDLPEKMFEADFPGHKCRQIKNVSVTLPALLGPYQDVHANLTQNTNKIYTDNAEIENGRAGQEIVLSQGLNDSGLFELNYRDERYLPFEGTGVDSSWTLNIPDKQNPGLLQNLTDVIFEVRYTAIRGTNS